MKWRSGRSFGAAPRHDKTSGTASRHPVVSFELVRKLLQVLVVIEFRKPQECVSQVIKLNILVK